MLSSGNGRHFPTHTRFAAVIRERENPDGSDMETDGSEEAGCFFCGKTKGLETCPDCGLVKFCGERHRGAHRRTKAAGWQKKKKYGTEEEDAGGGGFCSKFVVKHAKVGFMSSFYSQCILMMMAETREIHPKFYFLQNICRCFVFSLHIYTDLKFHAGRSRSLHGGSPRHPARRDRVGRGPGPLRGLPEPEEPGGGLPGVLHPLGGLQGGEEERQGGTGLVVVVALVFLRRRLLLLAVVVVAVAVVAFVVLVFLRRRLLFLAAAPAVAVVVVAAAAGLFATISAAATVDDDASDVAVPDPVVAPRPCINNHRASCFFQHRCPGCRYPLCPPCQSKERLLWHTEEECRLLSGCLRRASGENRERFFRATGRLRGHSAKKGKGEEEEEDDESSGEASELKVGRSKMTQKLSSSFLKNV